MVEVDPSTRRVVKFVEKPSDQSTASRLACPLFYVLKPQMVHLLPAFLETADAERPSLGSFVEWAVNERASPLYVRRAELPTTGGRGDAGCFRGDESRRRLPTRTFGRDRARAATRVETGRARRRYALRLPGVFRLIGDAGLQEYLDLVEHFERVDSPSGIET